ncbi:hypothetical protein BDN72DRAFT_290174 [Pluteus cervinus]|uniref:Uncharacterized protein n=1 Tax=Pluteus cervinus TaxID=181527 RepID=A0ACD3AGK8_9AGAR|nr:hypothetical protein BDN72DRAFT_290174 [Pluteus cervinus]
MLLDSGDGTCSLDGSQIPDGPKLPQNSTFWHSFRTQVNRWTRTTRNENSQTSLTRLFEVEVVERQSFPSVAFWLPPSKSGQLMAPSRSQREARALSIGLCDVEAVERQSGLPCGRVVDIVIAMSLNLARMSSNLMYLGRHPTEVIQTPSLLAERLQYKYWSVSTRIISTSISSLSL